MLLAVFKFWKDMFLETLIKKLGFRSKKAVDCILSCENHHLACQVAFIGFEALSQESVAVYIEESLKNRLEFNLNLFVKWRNTKVVNPNYNLLYDITFNLRLGLKLFRAGIPRNNSSHALRGKQKVAPIFFIGHHMIYIKHIIKKDMTIKVLTRQEIKQYIAPNEAFSDSGDHYRGEGGDYVTETGNRHLKSHLPPGVPTLSHWVSAARNNWILTKNRDKVYKRIGCPDPLSTESSILTFDDEI